MYMGLNLINGNDRTEIISSIVTYALNDLGCVHFEMVDRGNSVQDIENLGGDIFFQESLEIDLTLSEEELYKNMSSKSCRYSIRKAEKMGVRITHDYHENFADEYYGQLCDVFKKQDLVPTYDKARVKSLIENLYPSGNLLLLRALDVKNKCIATGIFPAFNKLMIFWGGASWREAQKLCPNEALIWYAMRYWKDKGIGKFDLGGGRGYKKKYGGCPIEVPGLRVSKYRFIGSCRNIAEKYYRYLQKINGLHKGKNERKENEIS